MRTIPPLIFYSFYHTVVGTIAEVILPDLSMCLMICRSHQAIDCDHEEFAAHARFLSLTDPLDVALIRIHLPHLYNKYIKK